MKNIYTYVYVLNAVCKELKKKKNKKLFDRKSLNLFQCFSL